MYHDTDAYSIVEQIRFLRDAITYTIEIGVLNRKLKRTVVGRKKERIERTKGNDDIGENIIETCIISLEIWIWGAFSEYQAAI